MKFAVKAAAPLLTAALLLSGCGGGQEPPQTYDLVEKTLPSLNQAVTLDDGFTFEQTTNEEDGSVTYIYSQLSSGGETTQAYTQILESDYDCTVWTDQDTGKADFSADSGEAKAAQPLEDSEEVFLLTIQWDETSCSITPSLAQKDVLPSSNTDLGMTLDEAVSYFESMPPSYLGLSGSSMDEYRVYPQEGTAFLDGEPCLRMNVYLAETHQLEQSYLLTLPARQVYVLDEETGQAVPLG